LGPDQKFDPLKRPLNLGEIPVPTFNDDIDLTALEIRTIQDGFREDAAHDVLNRGSPEPSGHLTGLKSRW